MTRVDYQHANQFKDPYRRLKGAGKDGDQGRNDHGDERDRGGGSRGTRRGHSASSLDIASRVCRADIVGEDLGGGGTSAGVGSIVGVDNIGGDVGQWATADKRSTINASILDLEKAGWVSRRAVSVGEDGGTS